MESKRKRCKKKKYKCKTFFVIQ